ncbi:hypothetical protein [Vallitalea okinawensis]|uniref:hypothetical protein n=1 Tax=Vallitalea okinawensis TaxID=2078660 RepID=UPI000CFAA604|nr:hypothetical protein [Vallitalea okinawensis]
MKIKINKRMIGIILIIIMLLPIVGQAWLSAASDNVEVLPSTLSDTDIEKARKLANETGTAIDDIYNWLSQGYDWNTIIQLTTHTKTEGEDLSKELLNMERQDLDFQEEKILEASQQLELVQFKLDEIITFSKESESYRNLKGKIINDDALYWMLTLEEHFNSLEDALGEYLVAIQLELDLNSLLQDEEAYEQEKFDKELQYMDELITLEKIEEEVLRVLTTMNDQYEEQENEEVNLPEVKVDVPKPSIENPKPVNPAEAIKTEIDNLKPQMD